MTAPTPEELRASYRLPEDDEDLLAECDVGYFRAPGPGGQHKNTTMTAVRLHHRPSGVVTIGRRERSRTRNVEDATRRLRARLELLLTPPKPRKATRVPKATKVARLAEKRRRSRRVAARRIDDD